MSARLPGLARAGGHELRPTRRTRGVRGFTLVELVVVVMILGLIGGIAASSWASMLPNQQFNSAVRNLSEVLYGTRSDAIARNRPFQIYYDLDHDRYWVRSPFKLDGGFATSADEPRRLLHETDLAASGIDLAQVTVDGQTFTDGLVEVVFSPLGNSAQHTILLSQVLFEREFTIEVLPLTGEVRLHDGEFARKPVDGGDFR